MLAPREGIFDAGVAPRMALSRALVVLALASAAGCARGALDADADDAATGGSSSSGSSSSSSGASGSSGASSSSSSGASSGSSSSSSGTSGSSGAPLDGGARDAATADAAWVGPPIVVTTLRDSASSGTPDTYQMVVQAGDPVSASITGGGAGPWSVVVSNGTSSGVYCSGTATCTLTVRPGDTVLFVTAVTGDIGSYALSITHPDRGFR